ncbi:hypothetical protein G7Z17_g6611 [Cylindrodendrum hubeiense]|uniref:Uncharacterized protein n=1 Tax=Cylindrodendrum hubeiense TaxID=595255 RepID=A0A9P5H8R2_9HYPO|nr:hypothetical protein G7Z17_g6611 [Cylindrodendrum hubeiense]
MAPTSVNARDRRGPSSTLLFRRLGLTGPRRTGPVLTGVVCDIHSARCPPPKEGAGLSRLRGAGAANHGLGASSDQPPSLSLDSQRGPAGGQDPGLLHAPVVAVGLFPVPRWPAAMLFVHGSAVAPGGWLVSNQTAGSASE